MNIRRRSQLFYFDL